MTLDPMLTDEGARGRLALELMPATAGPAGEERLEVFLVGGQALPETVGRLPVTLTCPQPTEAADAGAEGTLTCRERRGDWGLHLVLRSRKMGACCKGSSVGNRKGGNWESVFWVPSHTWTCHKDWGEEKPGRKWGGGGWAAYRGALSEHADQGCGTHFLRTHLIYPAACLTSREDVSGISSLRRSERNTRCSAPSAHQPVLHPRSRLENGTASYSSPEVSGSLGSSPPPLCTSSPQQMPSISLFRVLHALPSSLHLPGHSRIPCLHQPFLPNRRK